MKTEDVKRVRKLCREVAELCDHMPIENHRKDWVETNTRRSAELRRRSIDLTHALSDMRRPYRHDH